jgi:hypothetical protein
VVNYGADMYKLKSLDFSHFDLTIKPYNCYY